MNQIILIFEFMKQIISSKKTRFILFLFSVIILFLNYQGVIVFSKTIQTWLIALLVLVFIVIIVSDFSPFISERKRILKIKKTIEELPESRQKVVNIFYNSGGTRVKEENLDSFYINELMNKKILSYDKNDLYLGDINPKNDLGRFYSLTSEARSAMDSIMKELKK